MNTSIKVAALVALFSVMTAFAQTPARTAPDFSKLDTNHDGKLSKDEAMSDPTLSAKFTELDSDKDGLLSETEMNAAAKKRRER